MSGDGSGFVASFEAADEVVLEFLVKYKGRSFMHCRWIGHRHFVKRVDEAVAQRAMDRDGDSSMKSQMRPKSKRLDAKWMNDLIRIVRKWRKDGRPSTHYQGAADDFEDDSTLGNVQWYDPDLVQIDRVIDHEADRSRKSTKYLVKWKGSNYDDVRSLSLSVH